MCVCILWRGWSIPRLIPNLGIEQDLLRSLEPEAFGTNQIHVLKNAGENKKQKFTSVYPPAN